jgi:outer membrane protein assembly factor BamB
LLALLVALVIAPAAEAAAAEPPIRWYPATPGGGELVPAGPARPAPMIAREPSATRRCARPTFEWPVFGLNNRHTRNDCGHVRVLEPFAQRWSVYEDGILEFPPIYTGGWLYLGQDNGWLRKIDPETGEDVWAVRHMEIRQAPTYHDGLLFFTTRSGRSIPRATGLFAVDAETGQTVWRRKRFTGEASPVAYDSFSGHPIVCGTSSILNVLACHRADTGRVVWERRMSGCDMHSASALVKRKRRRDHVIFTADYCGNVWATSTRGGRLLWHRNYEGLSVYGSVAWARRRLFLASREGWVYALGSRKGKLLWRTWLGSPVYSSLAFSRGKIYGESLDPGTFFRLDARTGDIEWTYPAGHRALGSPVVVGWRVYFSDRGNKGEPGHVWSFRTVDMRLKWRFGDGKYTPVTPIRGGLILVGFGRLYRLDVDR